MGVDLGTVTGVQATNTDDPADVAAGMFQMYLPRFNNHVDQMSKKALQKLTKGLVAHTVEDMPGNLVTKEEREAFIIGVRLLEAKTMMYLAVIRDKLNEIEGNKNGVETNSSGQSDQGSGNEQTSLSSSEQITEGASSSEAGTDSPL